jgi:hypothetical protein
MSHPGNYTTEHIETPAQSAATVDANLRAMGSAGLTTEATTAIVAELVATTADLYCTLAAAAVASLPDPVSVTTHPGRQTACIHLYTAYGADGFGKVHAWRGWWEIQGVDGWTYRTQQGEGEDVHHHLTGGWRGWQVELTWITRPESTPAAAVAEPALAGAR